VEVKVLMLLARARQTAQQVQVVVPEAVVEAMAHKVTPLAAVALLLLDMYLKRHQHNWLHSQD
jgi:hypothetical protein